MPFQIFFFVVPIMYTYNHICASTCTYWVLFYILFYNILHKSWQVVGNNITKANKHHLVSAYITRKDVRCFVSLIPFSLNNDPVRQGLTHVLEMGKAREAQRGLVFLLGTKYTLAGLKCFQQ